MVRKTHLSLCLWRWGLSWKICIPFLFLSVHLGFFETPALLSKVQYVESIKKVLTDLWPKTWPTARDILWLVLKEYLYMQVYKEVVESSWSSSLSVTPLALFVCCPTVDCVMVPLRILSFKLKMNEYFSDKQSKNSLKSITWSAMGNLHA